MTQKIIGEERVFEELKNAVVEALGIEASSIQLQSKMVEDLGAESLDFLDISYRLEQVFGFKMARYFILEHAEELFGEGSVIDHNTQLTDKAVRLLKLRFGDDITNLEPGMNLDEFSTVLTVQSFVKGVMDILDTLPETCPSCNASDWKTDDGTHVVCGACGADALYKNGDELMVDWLKAAQEKERIF